MIKKLSLKFVLVFLVLVVSVIITSSCYASETFTYHDIYNITVDEGAGTVTIQDTVNNITKSYNCSTGFNNYSQYYIVVKYDSEDSSYPYTFNILFSNSFKWKNYGGYYCYVNISDLLLYYINADPTNSSNNSIVLMQTVTNPANEAFYLYGYTVDSSDVVFNYYCDETVIIYSNHTIYGRANTSKVLYEPSQLLSVDVTHEFQSDTSAKVNFTVNSAPEGAYLQYSLTGVEISTDLDAPVQLRNPVTYTPRSNKLSCKG